MENPYEAPNSRIDLPDTTEIMLAERGTRFGAAFVDGLIMIAVLLPIQLMTGYWQTVMAAAKAGQRAPIGMVMLWTAISLALFVAIQGAPLLKSGQTWGKKACSIKIVTLDGAKPNIQQLATRYGVYLLLARIPFVGPFISLVNICLIFRSDRRCGHDLAAGTRVVME